jgi:O-antigen ligase
MIPSKKISFLKRIALCMVISLALNAVLRYFQKESLTQGDFLLSVRSIYETDATMEFFFETGHDFNQVQSKSVIVKSGPNEINFPFKLKKGEQLRNLRIDFGSDRNLKKVALHSISLSAKGKILFDLKGQQIGKHIGFSSGITNWDSTNTYFLASDQEIFDPYLVFDSIFELIWPKWLRILLLVSPWVVLLALPAFKWIRERLEKKEYLLIFCAVFVSTIPLKMAWVSFAALILVAYALWNFFIRKHLEIGPTQWALLVFFAVPLLFLGDGNIAKMAIPMGFLLFFIIGSMLDFSQENQGIKQIYVKVFFMLMSIILVNSVLFIVSDGYYFKSEGLAYFSNVKLHSQEILYWIYYRHPTFLSFFIIIGSVFCVDLFRKGAIDRSFGVAYGLCTLLVLGILGSRFALLIALSLPFWYSLPIRYLKRAILPAWIILFGIITLFIDRFDVQRARLWRWSWSAIMERPCFGYGTGASEAVLPSYLSVNRGGVETLMEVNHSHNQLLAYLLENGLIGTLIFLAAFFYMTFDFAQSKNKTLLLVSFMLLLLMIVEAPFRTTTPLYLSAFLLTVFSKSSTAFNWDGRK